MREFLTSLVAGRRAIRERGGTTGGLGAAARGRAARRSVACLGAGLVLVVLVAGCAGRSVTVAPLPEKVVEAVSPAVATRAEGVRADPRAYLREVAERTRALDEYTTTFVRHERRGLFQQMHGPERIAAWFRREPFSVRMKWLDEDVKYGESVYVEGQEENQVRFVTRWWAPPLKPPPGVNRVDVQTPVFWGESRRPITQFGLERLMERTLAAIERAGADAKVTYEGTERLPDGGPTVHHIRIEVPPAPDDTPIQDLYIHVANDLPAGTVLTQASGRIDAAYYYTDVNTQVDLTDADFRLAAEGAPGKPGKPTGVAQ